VKSTASHTASAHGHSTEPACQYLFAIVPLFVDNCEHVKEQAQLNEFLLLLEFPRKSIKDSVAAEAYVNYHLVFNLAEQL
jgi:hypothetical protein